MFAVGQINDELTTPALDHGLHEFPDRPTALEVAPSLDPDPDLLVETSCTDCGGGDHGGIDKKGVTNLGASGDNCRRLSERIRTRLADSPLVGGPRLPHALRLPETDAARLHGQDGYEWK